MADVMSELWVLKIVYCLRSRKISPVFSSLPHQQSLKSTVKEVPPTTGSPLSFREDVGFVFDVFIGQSVFHTAL